MEAKSNIDATRCSQRTALITGASRGIGEAIALQLAHERFDVGLVGRDKAALEAVAQHCRGFGVRAEVYVVDLRDGAQIRTLAERVAADFGGVTVLVNNAGIFREGSIASSTIDDWEATVDSNIRPLFTLTKLVLPLLSRGSVIINIGSVASRRAYAGGGMYAASKHAVLGFSNSLFLELQEMGIKVSAILPGYVATAMHHGNETLDPEYMIQPKDVARAVSFVVNFPENACPTEITILPQHSPKVLR